MHNRFNHKLPKSQPTKAVTDIVASYKNNNLLPKNGISNDRRQVGQRLHSAFEKQVDYYFNSNLIVLAKLLRSLLFLIAYAFLLLMIFVRYSQ